MTEKQEESSFFSRPQFLLRGGLIGATMAAFLSWNTGKISKIGIFYRKWKLTRNFILPKPKLEYHFEQKLTKYYRHKFDKQMNNIICFSGESGIGKSSHFQSLCVDQSTNRPTFYIKFKSTGLGHIFQSYISEQLGMKGHVDDGASMISEIIKAAKKIQQINEKPHIFWIKYLAWHIAFFGVQASIFFSSKIQATIGILGLIGVLTAHAWYINFTKAFIVQSIRRTHPLLILDDINKVDNLGMIPQIARFLRLIDQKAGNVVLISSDQDIWTKLRSQPGMKDRLRLYQIKYDHRLVAKNLIKILQENYSQFAKVVEPHPTFTKQMVIEIVHYFIELRQITLRRFISFMKLNDEQQYIKLHEVLQNKANLPITEVTRKVAQSKILSYFVVFFQTEMQTMVANLKAIKRSLRNISNKQFIQWLRTLKNKGKLPADNLLAQQMQLYSIVREQRSQYVFNGRFMYTVFGMALEQYIKDMEQFEKLNQSHLSPEQNTINIEQNKNS